MSVLVTGVAGFIGSATARSLLERGDRVIGIDNINDYYDPSLKRDRLDLLGRQFGNSFRFEQLDFSDAEALKRLRHCRYSVLLLDLMMPVKSGWDVLDELKNIPLDVRPVVLVMTAGVDSGDLDAALIAGSISKPFDVELLIETVMACMNALTERNQLPDCPPADSSAVNPSEKVN